MVRGIVAIIKYQQAFLSLNKSLNIAFAMLVMAVIIYCNYYEHNFFSLVLLGSNHSWLRNLTGSFLLYFIPFVGTYFIQDKKIITVCLKNKWFIVLLFLAPAIFAFRVNFNFHHSLLAEYFHGDTVIFWQKCFDWLVRFILVMIPLYILWRWKDKHIMQFYGSGALQNFKAYFIMLFIMIPVIASAAAIPSFMNMYPRAQQIHHLNIHQDVFHYFVYELSYSIDFISIEFFFRGFLILAFMRITGMNCILPAACFYCCIHLGKPMPEAISSFFGGLILGTVSYHTKSIWGGLIVHLGIAWMMEIAGFTAHAIYK
ncbi:MAG: CPBP family intramembrane glutamic endopeptidase [Ferruginibacter sp.]